MWKKIYKLKELYLKHKEYCKDNIVSIQWIRSRIVHWWDYERIIKTKAISKKENKATKHKELSEFYKQNWWLIKYSLFLNRVIKYWYKKEYAIQNINLRDFNYNQQKEMKNPWL